MARKKGEHQMGRRFLTTPMGERDRSPSFHVEDNKQAPIS